MNTSRKSDSLLPEEEAALERLKEKRMAEHAQPLSERFGRFLLLTLALVLSICVFMFVLWLMP